MMLVWLVLNVLMVLAGEFLPGLFESFLANSPRRIAVFNYAVMPLVYIGVFSLQFFAIPIAAVTNRGTMAAILDAFKLFLRNPVTAFFLAAFVLAIPAIIGAVNSDPGRIIDRFKPELAYWLLVIGLGAELVANFFWLGTSVRFIHDEDH